MKSRVITAGSLALAGTLLLAGCSAGGPSGSTADFAPKGTLKIVVAMAAGGGSDRSARVISQAINEGAEGFSTVVDNREGGGGAIGWSYFHSLKGKPENLLVAETAMHTLPRQDGVDVPFTYKDFTPIALFAEDSRMLVAPKNSPYNTCSDVIEASKAKPILSGMSGTFGADGMVLGELAEEGLNYEAVPFGSTGEVVTGLLGGQIEVAPASAAAVKPYIESGDFKGLCTFSEARYADDPILKDVATANEQGIDATVVLWRGVLAPGGITDQARDFWVDEFTAALETDAYKEYLKKDLLIGKTLFGDEFAAYLDEYDAMIEGIFK